MRLRSRRRDAAHPGRTAPIRARSPTCTCQPSNPDGALVARRRGDPRRVLEIRLRPIARHRAGRPISRSTASPPGTSSTAGWATAAVGLRRSSTWRGRLTRSPTSPTRPRMAVSTSTGSSPSDIRPVDNSRCGWPADTSSRPTRQVHSRRSGCGSVVAQAGVLDLIQGAAVGLGRRRGRPVLGGTPGEVPERYAVASPVRAATHRRPVDLDRRHQGQGGAHRPERSLRCRGDRCRRRGRRADDSRGVDHFAPIDPRMRAWASDPPALVPPNSSTFRTW